MIALRIVAPAKVEIAEVEKPKLERGTVLVNMQVGAICGSDLYLFKRRHPPEDYPLSPVSLVTNVWASWKTRIQAISRKGYRLTTSGRV